MQTNLSVLVERMIPSDDGTGYVTGPVDVVFISEHDGNVVAIACGNNQRVHIHVSDLLSVAEKFNAVTKFRPDFSPFNQE